ncbi:hypothetical protein F0562_007658 [Nyssa sinensis]|uniref:Uncharacterized protein n=1 Tax=Nyssa sinensis TaxID=561372 RepID=A0A5J5A4I7_9ASTE|nr:hypothetical protein F0562_007658 [Nyssa sinensis]
MDYSTLKEGHDGRLSEMPSRAAGKDIPDLCIKAVMEAKTWLEEKKVGSSSKSDLDHETCTFNSVELPHVTESELGSPVDMAKSYMQARPAWASPSISHIDLKTPPPAGIDLFKDETPYSVGHDSFSSSKKRDSLATGSWNILEEIRRKRFWRSHKMIYKCEALPSNPVVFVSEENQIQHQVTEIVLQGKVNELKGTPNANGFPSSGSSLSAGLVIKQNPRPSDEENQIPVDSSHDNGVGGKLTSVSSSHEKFNNSVPVEKTCELLSEASIQVPVVNETNSIARGSQNSCSTRNEESSQELTQDRMAEGNQKKKKRKKRDSAKAKQETKGKEAIENRKQTWAAGTSAVGPWQRLYCRALCGGRRLKSRRWSWRS